MSLSGSKIITRSERETIGLDNKLAQLLGKIKFDAENSSKIVDENGEIVAYHGNGGEKRLNVLDPGRGQNAEAVWHAKDINNEPTEGTNAATRPFLAKKKATP